MTDDQERWLSYVKGCIDRGAYAANELGLVKIIDELRAEVARLTRERDEARGLVRGTDCHDVMLGAGFRRQIREAVARWDAEAKL